MAGLSHVSDGGRGPLGPLGRRLFWGAVLLAALALVLATALAAPRAFFAEDDFRWLAHVRAEGFSLLDAYFPYAQRSWWAYRPLSMHTYWLLGQGLFGFSSLGFHLTSMGVHFGGGLLVYRLAARLGFPREIAALTALLAVSRSPSIEVLFWASAFSYFAVATASVAALLVLAKGLARAGPDGRVAPGWRAGSAALLLVALLCQESALLLVPILLGLAWISGAERTGVWGRSLGSALRTTAPHVAVAGLWAVQRFVLIAPYPRQANYRTVLGPNVPRNVLAYSEQIAGGGAALLGLAAVAATVGVGLWRAPATRTWLRDHALPRFALIAAWAIGMAAAFAPVRMTAPRFAIAAEIPLCLLAGAVMTGAWHGLGRRHRGALLLALLAAVVASFPYPELARAYTAPRGSGARAMLEQIERLDPPLAAGDCLVVLHDGPGLLAHGWWVQRECWSGTPMLEALRPGAHLTLAFARMDAPPRSLDFAPRCRLYALRPDLSLEPADAALRREHLLAGLDSRSGPVAAAAAERLAHDFGAQAIDALVARATPNGAIAAALLLIDDPRAAATARTLIPDPALRDTARARLRARWGAQTAPD